MLNSKVEQVLIAQIDKEGYSSNLYLAMASWAENKGLKGIADWLYAQADEERLHMLKFVKYVNERGGQAVISAVAEPPKDFKSVKVMFNEVLKHEEMITASINNIVGVCLDQKDFTTQNYMQWFVTEQIEEEASVRGIIDKLNLVGETNLYLFDRDIMSLRGTGATAKAQ